jgi:hypothetical protein
MRKRSLSTAALAALAIVVAAGSVAVAATTTGKDGSSLSADAKITPKGLSKAAPTPAALEIATKTTTSNPAGAVNPVVQAVMDFDKNGSYFAKGLPSCGEKELFGKDRATALKLCETALIGTGRAVAVASFFEADPIDVKATLDLFNGIPQGGKPTVLIYAYSEEPVATSFTFSGVVSKYNKEGFGSRFEIQFPKLFNGAGAISEFNLELQKEFTYKGQEHSLVSAKCPSSKKLKARIAFTYLAGETLTVPVTQTCQQKG